MRPNHFLYLPLFIICGCQQFQVQNMANNLQSTVPGLYEQEVLDNLAMLAAKPEAIPYIGTANQSTAQNTRTVQASYSPAWDFITSTSAFAGRWLFDKQVAVFQGSFANADSIQMAPTNDPDRLLLVRSALHRVLGSPDSYDSILAGLHPTTGKDWAQYDSMIQPGWINVGSKKDVPKKACYVGRYCDTYVWVSPNQVDKLTGLTLAVLNILTLQPTIATPEMKAILEKGGGILTPRLLPFPVPTAPPPAGS